MAKKRKAKVSPLKAQYMKERRRVQSFLRSAKKRGYEFQENVLPPIPKKITKASISRLQKLNPKTLYPKATFKVREKTPEGWIEKQVSGRRGRQIERERAGRYGYQKRQAAIEEGFKNVAEYERAYSAPEKTPTQAKPKSEWKQPDINISADEEWYTEDELAVKDTLDRLAQQQGYANYGDMKHKEALNQAMQEYEEQHPYQPSEEPLDRPLVGGVQFDDEGTTALWRINQMIAGLEGNAYELVKNVLAEEIEKYGADAVGKSLANIPEEEIKKLERELHYKDSQNATVRSMTALVNAIRGTTLSDEDSKAILAATEQYEDWEEY